MEIRIIGADDASKALTMKEAITEMVDFHSARPGHDLRYALDGGLMRTIGWEPKLKFSERIQQVSDWYLSRNEWLEV